MPEQMLLRSPTYPFNIGFLNEIAYIKAYFTNARPCASDQDTSTFRRVGKSDFGRDEWIDVVMCTWNQSEFGHI